jgi:hypothetical protein
MMLPLRKEISPTQLGQGRRRDKAPFPARAVILLSHAAHRLLAGRDFKAGFVDEAPVSNADIGKTLARILQLKIADKGKLVGRVVSEAMPGGTTPRYVARTMSSEPTANGLRTVLDYQSVGATRYFDAAGFPGRTVGLQEPMRQARNAAAKP